MRYTALLIACFFSVAANAQRTYRNNSVLANGDWYKIAVKQPGIYRINIAFLQSLGINIGNLQSGTVRLFGNGGEMLPEDNAVVPADDLLENAIMVVDGGDGVINGNDYLLFYANGPQQWVKDSANKRFKHRKNLYGNESYYYLNIAGTGLRVQSRTVTGTPNQIVTAFKDRIFHELDTSNFLRSGKEWYGEEFSNTPGGTTNRTFSFTIPNFIAGSVQMISNVAARSNGIASSFIIRANNSNVAQHTVSAVGTGNYDPVAAAHELAASFNLSQAALSLQYSYQPASVNSQGWLNWFELFPQRQLSMSGIDQLLFRDWETVGAGNIAEFRLQNAASSTMVWDVTDPLRPQNITGALNGNELRLVNTAERLREYVAFNQTNFLQPAAVGKISNQDLHGATAPNYIIVTHPTLLSEAQRLATWHRQNQNLTTLTVSTEQVYHEFGSG
ncbi:MAG: hypothetical protein KA160_04605, partial [Lacibacter sp.]|nr:hypothetical protein [Lacibacter sp.]